MDFGKNKTPIEEFKEGAFAGTYFRDIYIRANNRWYGNSWLKTLMVGLMISLFLLWLGNFYSFGAMNWLKMVTYNSYFTSYKYELLSIE